MNRPRFDGAGSLMSASSRHDQPSCAPNVGITAAPADRYPRGPELGTRRPADELCEVPPFEVLPVQNERQVGVGRGRGVRLRPRAGRCPVVSNLYLEPGGLVEDLELAEEAGLQAPDGPDIPAWGGPDTGLHLDPGCYRVAPLAGASGSLAKYFPVRELATHPDLSLSCGCYSVWDLIPQVAHLNGIYVLERLEDQWKNRDGGAHQHFDASTPDGYTLAMLVREGQHLTRLEEALAGMPDSLVAQVRPRLATRRAAHDDDVATLREALTLPDLSSWLGPDRYEANADDTSWVCDNCEWCFDGGLCDSDDPCGELDSFDEPLCGCADLRSVLVSRARAAATLETRVARVVLVWDLPRARDWWYGNSVAAALEWFGHIPAPGDHRNQPAAMIVPGPLARTMTSRGGVVDAGPVPHGWSRTYVAAATDPAVRELVQMTLRLWADRRNGARGGLANGATALRSAAAAMAGAP